MIDSNLPEMVFRRANHILVVHPLHLSETVRTNMRDHRGSQQEHLNRLPRFGSVKTDYKQNRSNLTTIISAKRVSILNPKQYQEGTEPRAHKPPEKGHALIYAVRGSTIPEPNYNFPECQATPLFSGRSWSLEEYYVSSRAPQDPIRAELPFPCCWKNNSTGRSS
ncbi:hypothetical protein BDV27DRAFT_68810 [Aspergillus caelatus]|uniref:Uncharacterized protein n=1 Tax=Aspergillus caelatus TaxID=61420 RepID=A0A5N7ACQ2_9EURO|nr:uncharacterized protein BDV27DRAFT_68810 [Aspergillus caelatus]KAE8367634.1 hypothetical protein BDV27DRAFT_68810 [Aspergillus caelatus]